MCFINPKFKKTFILEVCTAHGTEAEFNALLDEARKRLLEVEIGLNADGRLRWYLSERETTLCETIKTITQAEYEALAAKTYQDLKEFFDSQPEIKPRVIKLTCDDCIHRFTCEFSADGYNIDGDCLAMK